MNLHAPVPIVEEVQAAPPVDEVARLLADARLRDGAELLDALEARRVELGLANSTVEDLANLARGHLTKMAGPARRKSPTLASLDKVMAVLGLSFVLVRDPEKAARVQSNWRRRDDAHVRARPPSSIAVAKSRPVVLAELARKARHPKWRGVPAADFMRAQVKENT